MTPAAREFFLVTLALVATSALGAWMSRFVRAGGAWWLVYLGSMPSLTVWAWQARYSKLPLTVSSALYDAATAGAWFFFLVLFGEDMNWVQWVGVALLVGGLSLVNWR